MAVNQEAPTSQFAFVILAAKRARQLMAGAPMLLAHTRAHKPTRIAVEELRHSLLEYQHLQPGEKPEEDAGKQSE
ncbi:MAG TPA: DNA-directed RNA polymerase subunit omega [Candidatus Binatia bacterium]|nr:DNA-directed RNA polymerase subunit omega [Candidatus Binatia bacterium]